MINMLLAECRSAGFSIQENLKGGTIMLYFEKAMINAATISFPGCKVQGCRFHLGQSWWKKMKNLGLSRRYRTAGSPEGRWLRGVFGLPLLPAMMVKKAFNLYCKTRLGKKPELKQFQTYLYSTYIKSNAPFPIAMWADLQGPKTNNGAESFHRH